MDWKKLAEAALEIAASAAEEANKKKGKTCLIRATGSFNHGLYLLNNTQHITVEKGIFETRYYILLYTSTASLVASALKSSGMDLEKVTVTSPKGLVITTDNFNTISVSEFVG